MAVVDANAINSAPFVLKNQNFELGKSAVSYTSDATQFASSVKIRVSVTVKHSDEKPQRKTFALTDGQLFG